MSLGLLTRGYVCPGGTGVSAGPTPEIIDVRDIAPKIETTAVGPNIICPPVEIVAAQVLGPKIETTTLGTLINCPPECTCEKCI